MFSPVGLLLHLSQQNLAKTLVARTCLMISTQRFQQLTRDAKFRTQLQKQSDIYKTLLTVTIITTHKPVLRLHGISEEQSGIGNPSVDAT